MKMYPDEPGQAVISISGASVKGPFNFSNSKPRNPREGRIYHGLLWPNPWRHLDQLVLGLGGDQPSWPRLPFTHGDDDLYVESNLGSTARYSAGALFAEAAVRAEGRFVTGYRHASPNGKSVDNAADPPA